jgi:UDP-glucuronate 4-epimerase
VTANPAALVTGAGGCIGAWTIRQLLAEGVPVLALDLRRDLRRLSLLIDVEELDRITWATVDIADLAALRAALEGHTIGSMIHLAALQAPFCRADPPLGAAVNVVGTVNLLEIFAERRGETGPFVYASSIAAAEPAGGDHPATIYGVYKRACEGAADVYRREHGMASIGLRPHTVYGPGRDQGMTSAPSLAMHAAASGRAYEIPFTGRLTMQYAPDVAAAFVASSRAEGYEGAGVFDLPGETVDVSEILAAIAAVAPEATITSTGPPLVFPADVHFSADAPFAHALSPTSLADGVGDAIARFRELEIDGRIVPPARPR